MPVPLRVLILEDVPADAEVLLDELRRSGFDPAGPRVDSEAAYLAHLSPEIDVILADYNLPDFDAARALSLLQARGLAVPFIVVSGTLGEDVAVAMMRQSATDYLFKDRLARLGAAVTRALEVRRLRQANQQAELALRESEERYRLITETINETLFLIDLEGRVLFSNRRGAELTGYEVHALQGRSIFELVAPETADLARQRLATLREGREVAQAFEGQVVRRDGSMRSIEASVASVMKEGRLVGRLAVIRDITERKRAEETLRQSEEQLRQAQKMDAIGHLAGGVAHDFNNLLTVIIGRARMLGDAMGPDDRARRYVDLIHKTAERAAALTSQLLAFSRKQPARAQVLRLDRVVAGITPMLRRLIGENVDVIVNSTGTLRRVRADRAQLEQLIMNLAVNARDAMPHGGRLVIETGNVELQDVEPRLLIPVPAGPYALLAVSDTGTGMSREVRARIFEPFFTTKEPGRGTGLGLSMVYGIVRNSGGSITLESDPERGSRFEIYLPAVESSEEDALDVPSVTPFATGQETLLLVEDEGDVRALAREILAGCGYTVLEASNAGAAQRIWATRREQIQMVVTDVVMPGTSGRLLAARLRESKPQIKVLFISGYAPEPPGEQGAPEHLGPLLPKPFTPYTLASAVRNVLDGRRPG